MKDRRWKMDDIEKKMKDVGWTIENETFKMED